MNWQIPGPLAGIPPVADEILAHFLFRKELRGDGTVKPEAVIPYPHENLSVTRHRDLREGELRASGENIAKTQGRTLFGRADFRTMDLPEGLFAVSDEPPRNHADIRNWPLERSAQLAKAILLLGKCIGVRYAPAAD